MSRNLGDRDFAVDVLRGIAVIGMILVNHGPPTNEIYGFLVHAPWTGWTFADTIFPMFLLLVGISIAYSSAKQLNKTRSAPYARIVRRTVLLILISIALVNFPYYAVDTLILQGTLFRIAVCYFVAVMLNHYFGWRTQIGIIAAILFVQWWFLTRYSVPGFGSGVITVEGNASSYLDQLILGPFAERLTLNTPVSQGLLPTAAAIATTMTGTILGVWLRTRPNTATRDYQLTLISLALIVAGHLWGMSYPVSKPLWTGSYVLFMGGLSMLLLAIINWLQRFPGLRKLGVPFEVAGVNALFFYVFAQSFQRLLVYGKIANADGTATRYRYYIYQQWIEPWLDGKAGALMYALIYLTLCYLIVVLLYRRRIFVKL